jgi:rhodanese-related sulfurtransferase
MKKLNSLVAQCKKIAMVDCRGAEERAVSVIRGSIIIPGVELVSVAQKKKYTLADAIDAVDFTAAAGCDFVLAISSAGAESGAAAALLSKKIGAPAHNLCGGIIAWFNAGGEVVDVEGRSVEAVHPGSKRCIGFVKPRKNTFKFGKK